MFSGSLRILRQPEKHKGTLKMEKIKLQVYRYNPDRDAKPYMQDYELEISPIRCHYQT